MNEKFPAQGYKDNVLLDCFADAKRYFLDHYLAVDRAHAVMLAEQNIITADEQLYRLVRELRFWHVGEWTACWGTTIVLSPDDIRRHRQLVPDIVSLIHDHAA